MFTTAAAVGGGAGGVTTAAAVAAAGAGAAEVAGGAVGSVAQPNKLAPSNSVSVWFLIRITHLLLWINLSSIRLLERRESAGAHRARRLHHELFKIFITRHTELAASEIPCAGDWASPDDHLTPFIRA